jgi:hypothetical protein
LRKKYFSGLPYSEKDYQKGSEHLSNTVSLPEDFVSSDAQKEILKSMKELMAQHFFLISNKKHPLKHKLSWFALCGLFACVLGLVYFINIKYSFISSDTLEAVSFLVGLILIKVYFSGSYDYTHLAKDLVKQCIAINNGWLYEPKVSYSKGQDLNAQFPDVFNYGSKIVGVDDEFLGVRKVEAKNYLFKSGLYKYKVKRQSKSRWYYPEKLKYKTINSHYIYIRLNKKINSEFLLVPEFAKGIFSNFGSREINLESHEFNKLFRFEYHGEKKDRELEITKNLSPAVQLGLVKLAQRRNNFKFLFSKDALVFLFNGTLASGLETSIYNYNGVKKTDINAIEKEILEVIDLSVEVTKYLD